MTNRQMTLVYYHVPQDRDDPNNPNVFGVPQHKNKVKLSHIHQVFPLKGSYLFRFKYNHEGTDAWLDLPDVESKIPLYKDKVIMKATRVTWNESKLHSQYRQKNAKADSIPKQEAFDFFENENRSTDKPNKNGSNGIDFMGNGKEKTQGIQHSQGFNLLDDHHGSRQDSSTKNGEINFLNSHEQKGGDLI